MEENGIRWFPRASKRLETRSDQSVSAAESGKTADEISTGCGRFGKTAAALFVAVAVAAATIAALTPHRLPACAIAADAPLPWMQQMQEQCQ